jgi:hypothetical protein
MTLSGVADLPNLSGWWKLDEGSGTAVSDSSGNGYDGTLYGTPDWGTDFLFENVLNFNGSTNQVKMPGYLGVSGGQSRTVCAWIKTTQLSGGIVNYGSNVDGGRWLFILDGNGKLQLGISGGNIKSTQVVADGQWHHVTGMLEAPAEGPTRVRHLRLYIDGQPAAGTYTNPDTIINTIPEYPVRIGVIEGPAGTLGSYFAGRIHDVRMYDTALTAEEIQQFFLGDLDLVGSGTSEDPYQITTAEQLVLIGTIPAFLDDCFILNNDIVFDLNTHRDYIFSRALIAPDMDTNAGFMGTPFTGVFDGNHHVIRNLTIIGFNIEYIGLFGKCESAIIKNLILEDMYIFGWISAVYDNSYYYYIGGIVGCQINGTISGCSADGSIELEIELSYVHRSNIPYMGGIVGYQDNGKIYDCSAAVSVLNTGIYSSYYGTISSCSGGLAGYQNGGTIEHCYATGPVEAQSNTESNAGGLVGYQNDGTVDHCYATGSVEVLESGKSYAGGLIGYQNNGTIKRCYSTGSTEASAFNIASTGGLVGYQKSGTIDQCYSISNSFGFTSQDVVYDPSLYTSAGGLVGESCGIICNCYTISETIASSLSNKSYAGGLVGYTKGTVNDCYARGSVSAFRYDDYYTFYCGGLVGRNNNGTINRSFATCVILGNDYYRQGLFGYQSGESAVTENCFWDTQTSGTEIGYNSSSYGTIINVFGKTTVEMQQFDIFISAGWDFVGEEENGTNDFWRMCLDKMDYPRLSWEYSTNGDFDCPDGVGLEDLESLVYHWLTADSDPAFNYACDGSGDGFVGQEDLAILSQNWLEELWEVPLVSVSPRTIFFAADEGGNDPNWQEVIIQNAGIGTLEWAIESEEPVPDWLFIDPVSGSLGRGEGQSLTLSADISGLAAGDYAYTFGVADPNAANSPQTVTVNLHIRGLVAYWALDEEGGTTAADSSGNGHRGTLVDFADPNSSWTAGQVGNCLAFDGSDDRVDVNGYAGIGGTQPRTVCAWIQLSSTASTGTILSYGGSDLRSSWLFMVNSDRKLQLGVNEGNMIGNPVLAAGRWYHVAAVLEDWDSDGLTVGDLRLYIDGQEVSGTYKNPNEAIFTGNTYPVRIGTHVSVNYFFGGRIDELQLYDAALSPGQIALLATE